MALDTGQGKALEFKTPAQLVNDAAWDLEYGETVLTDKAYEDTFGIEGAQFKGAAYCLLGIGKLLLAQARANNTPTSEEVNTNGNA